MAVHPFQGPIKVQEVKILFNTYENNIVLIQDYKLPPNWTGQIEILFIIDLIPQDDTNGEYGFIDLHGDEVVKPEFDWVVEFSEGYACVAKGENFYYVNNTKRELLNPGRGLSCNPFTYGLAMVQDRSHNKVGYMDTSFNLVIPCIYDNPCTVFFSEYASVTKDRVIYLINREGKVILSNLPSLTHFFEGLGAITVNGKYGFIDIKGNLVVPCEYDMATSFVDGVSIVTKDGKRGLINQTGHEIIPNKYIQIDPFHEGMAAYQKAKKFGFLNTRGEEVIAHQFREVDHFSEGLAPVRVDKMWGYMDIHGTFVFEPQFEYARPFSEGHARVYANGQHAIIDKQMNIKCYDPKYDWLGDLHNGYICVMIAD